MRNLKSWLQKEGYNVKAVTIYNAGNTGKDIDGLLVDIDYIGPYPGKAQFDALDKIRRHVSRFYPEKTVAQRGHYSAVCIY